MCSTPADVNELFTAYDATLKSSLDVHAPLRHLRRSTRRVPRRQTSHTIIGATTDKLTLVNHVQRGESSLLHSGCCSTRRLVTTGRTLVLCGRRSTNCVIHRLHVNSSTLRPSWHHTSSGRWRRYERAQPLQIRSISLPAQLYHCPASPQSLHPPYSSSSWNHPPNIVH